MLTFHYFTIRFLIYLYLFFRSSVTRSPQQEKAALQVSSKYTDKVPGATPTITGVADEEKENNTNVVGSPTLPVIAPLAVPESLDDSRAKPSSTTSNTATSSSVHNTAVQPKDITTTPKVVSALRFSFFLLVLFSWIIMFALLSF
jgi:hypothetical protein